MKINGEVLITVLSLRVALFDWQGHALHFRVVLSLVGGLQAALRELEAHRSAWGRTTAARPRMNWSRSPGGLGLQLGVPELARTTTWKPVTINGLSA